MLIVIEKIITRYKKDNDNKLVLDPISEKKIPLGFKVVQEAIRGDEIKSIRPFYKGEAHEQSKEITGDMSVLYMYGDKTKSRPAEIQIMENFKAFAKRAGAIELINAE